MDHNTAFTVRDFNTGNTFHFRSHIWTHALAGAMRQAGRYTMDGATVSVGHTPDGADLIRANGKNSAGDVHDFGIRRTDGGKIEF